MSDYPSCEHEAAGGWSEHCMECLQRSIDHEPEGLSPPPGFDYVCRASQAGDDGEDVWTYAWAETGRLVHVNSAGRAYHFMGTTVSGDPVYLPADEFHSTGHPRGRST